MQSKGPPLTLHKFSIVTPFTLPFTLTRVQTCDYAIQRMIPICTRILIIPLSDKSKFYILCWEDTNKEDATKANIIFTHKITQKQGFLELVTCRFKGFMFGLVEKQLGVRYEVFSYWLLDNIIFSIFNGQISLNSAETNHNFAFICQFTLTCSYLHLFHVIWNPTKYPTTLAASTLIILFSEMLKFLEIKILK